jgi:hypothetical protein
MIRSQMLRFVYLVTSCVAASTAAGAQTLSVNSTNAVTIAAGPDFATTVIGDPWDFSQATDYVLMFSDGWDRSTMAVTSGKFTGVVSAANPVFPLLQTQFEGINGALNIVGRNGVRFPIDTSAYNQIVFRMRRSVAPHAFDLIETTWFQETTRTTSNSGARLGLSTGFDDVHQRYINQSPVASQSSTASYHIYKIDLDRALPVTTRDVNRSWTSSSVARGIRLGLGEGVLAPDTLSNATIEVDWVRLVRRAVRTVLLSGTGFASRVTLTATNGADTIQIFPDGALGAADNSVTPAGSFQSTFTYTWDVGFLPPGVWTVTASDGATSRQVTVTIGTPPIIHVTEPDAAGGTDFSTAVIGDPWDLANAEDVTRYGLLNNITNASYSASGLLAQTAAVGPIGTPNIEDSAVYFLTDDLRPGTNPPTIDANTYRHLTFTIEYMDNKTATGPEALGNTLGGVARVIWRRRITPPATVPLTDTEDIFVLDGGPQTYSMDLGSFSLVGSSSCSTCHFENETDPGLNDLWAGQIGTFRIDPLETQTTRTFRIANVKIAADDAPTSGGFFTIRWTATDATFAAAALTTEDTAVADATVTLYYDGDTDPASKTLIASGLSASAGSYTWNLGGIPTGRYFIYSEITDAAGNTQGRYSTGPVRIATAFPGTTDSDGDGLPDAFESKYGVTSPTADEDADGVNNLAEFSAGTNPRIPNTWNLPEGATGFFQERIAVANPDTDAADISVTFLRETGSPIVQSYSIPGQSRTTITVNDIAGLSSAAVSAVVNTTRGGVVVERTMLWNALDGSFYGGHTGKAIQTARTQWYLAEGEANFFETYILFANANSAAASVTAQYLLESGAVVTRNYTVGPNARLTVRTNDIAGVAGNAFSTTITSDIAITVERAMYFSTGGRLFNGGHEAAAVAAPATSWFVAEGRTGPFFDMYLLLANPGSTQANATVTFIKPSGSPVVETRTLAPTSRTTIHVDSVSGLADTDVSASITSDQPIIVERAMYWPDPFTNWYEAHNSSGVTSTGTQWALAEGEIGGALGFETYILLANPGSSPASVTLTFLRTSGAAITSTFVVPANARVTRSAGEFGLSSGEKFGLLIDASQPIAVERAMYWNGGGQFWGGGTNETAVKVR